MNSRYLRGTDYLFYVALNWYRIIAVFVAVTILMSAVSAIGQKRELAAKAGDNPGGIKQETVSIDEEEGALVATYIDNREAMRKQQEYNDNALYMQINCENVFTVVNRYTLSCDPKYNDAGEYVGDSIDVDGARNRMYRTLLAEGTCAYIVQNISVDTEEVYIRELMSYDTGTSHVLTVNVLAPSEELGIEISDALDKFIASDVKPDAEGVYGAFKLERTEQNVNVSRDNGMRDTQANNVAKLTSLGNTLVSMEDNFTDDQLHYIKVYDKLVKQGLSPVAGEPLTHEKEIEIGEVSIKDAILSGLKWGGIAVAIYIVLLFAYYIGSGRIWYAEAFSDTFNVPVLARLSASGFGLRRNEKFNGRIWKMRDKISTGKINDHNKQVFIFNLRSKLKEDGEIIVVSDSLGQCDKADAYVKSMLPEDIYKRIVIVSEGMIAADESFLERCKNSAGILFMELWGQSRYSDFKETKFMLAAYEENILGAVLVE